MRWACPQLGIRIGLLAGSIGRPPAASTNLGMSIAGMDVVDALRARIILIAW